MQCLAQCPRFPGSGLGPEQAVGFLGSTSACLHEEAIHKPQEGRRASYLRMWDTSSVVRGFSSTLLQPETEKNIMYREGTSGVCTQGQRRSYFLGEVTRTTRVTAVRSDRALGGGGKADRGHQLQRGEGGRRQGRSAGLAPPLQVTKYLVGRH